MFVSRVAKMWRLERLWPRRGVTVTCAQPCSPARARTPQRTAAAACVLLLCWGDRGRMGGRWMHISRKARDVDAWKRALTVKSKRSTPQVDNKCEHYIHIKSERSIYVRLHCLTCNIQYFCIFTFATCQEKLEHLVPSPLRARRIIVFKLANKHIFLQWQWWESRQAFLLPRISTPCTARLQGLQVFPSCPPPYLRNNLQHC